jgi:hypothetical protein
MIDSDFLILAVVSFTRELVVNFYCKSTPGYQYLSQINGSFS